MKVAANRIEGFLRKPHDGLVAALFFGPDDGLVRERARALAKGLVGDLSDPFRVSELSGTDVKADPPALIDAARQLPMTGERAVVFVREATDGVAETLAQVLEGDGGGNLVVVEAGNLAKSSSLRKLFEKAANAAAVGCYADDARGLAGVVAETLERHGLKADAEARAFLAANLGSDRLVSRSELEKLALYCQGKGTVTLEDAMAAVGDSTAMSLETLVFAVTGGDQRALDRAFERAMVEGTSPVRILRFLQNHLQRLHFARAMVAAGETPEKAMAKLRPPVFFKFASPFRAQLRQWRPEGLAQALALATEAEVDCKSTGFPDRAGCHRALMRIAQAARAGARAA